MAQAPIDPDTEVLLAEASRGDQEACQQLLSRHRARLRQMVALRMDRRLAARVDPSDVVQEALTTAGQKLSGYLRERPLPFYPWLRHFAWERLLQLHRHHIRSQRRSVSREERWDLPLPDDSVFQLADRLAASGTSPSHHLVRDEQRQRLRVAMCGLTAPDREVLMMRYLEQLSFDEIAAALATTQGAVKMRHLRALRRLRVLLEDEDGGPRS
jgi:RNA polymerase sigma-70 factor, ECF subfamily